MSIKKQGFASFSKEKHLEASSKGGKAKVSKGFGALSPEERNKIALRGSEARWNNKKEGQNEQTNPTTESA